eukprot:CAMPEP_0182427276 /NCGR_PEP_ID=MMETSP1167-20130531/16663_1 /TAXON_ID=2988 /ORGANISM="Mallomonas Sp, Strain CCMP3275" /LENGTH=345 /DNA_ID=CAMNT_0024609403 /DNA_START=186 /DNA_END=1223 /DNA_ORIENTATION=+
MEKRAERLRNPRGLAMGIDSQALDAQINEKRAKEQAAKEADRIEKLKLQEIDRVLEEAAKEERQRKEYEKQKMKEDWRIAQEEITAKKSIVFKQVDPESCGTGACQTFAGEDPGHDERAKMQKAQMRRWTQEQLAEKAYRQQKQKEDEDNYAQYVHTLDYMLGETQQEQQEMRRKTNLDFARANKEQADEVMRKKAAEREHLLKMDKEEISSTMSLGLMLEDVSEAVVNDHGKIARRDHFKGFTTEQKQKIIRENEMLLKEQREAERKEKLREAIVSNQQLMANRELEKIVTEQAIRKEMERKELVSKLKEQMDEQTSKKSQSRADRFGTIDLDGGSLFSKFNGR